MLRHPPSRLRLTRRRTPRLERGCARQRLNGNCFTRPGRTWRNQATWSVRWAARGHRDVPGRPRRGAESTAPARKPTESRGGVTNPTLVPTALSAGCSRCRWTTRNRTARRSSWRSPGCGTRRPTSDYQGHHARQPRRPGGSGLGVLRASAHSSRTARASSLRLDRVRPRGVGSTASRPCRCDAELHRAIDRPTTARATVRIENAWLTRTANYAKAMRGRTVVSLLDH